MEKNPETNIVEGTQGGAGPVLLTVLFRGSHFMLFFLLEHNTPGCVCQVFNFLKEHLGTEERPFESLIHGDVTAMMDHINSITRASLNGHPPFELAPLLLPKSLLHFLGAKQLAFRQ